MARLNTAADEPPEPAPARPTKPVSKTPSKPASKTPKKPAKPTVIDLSSSPPSPASPPPPPPPPLRPTPGHRRRRLIRKQVVLLDSDDEGAHGRRRRSGSGSGSGSGESDGDGDGGKEEEEDVVAASLSLSKLRLQPPPPPPPPPPPQRGGGSNPNPNEPPRQRFIPRKLPLPPPSSTSTSTSTPTRGRYQYHPPAPAEEEAEEVATGEDEESPEPSSEGSGDELGSEDSAEEEGGGQEGENWDEYESSFVVGDSEVEFESGGSGLSEDEELELPPRKRVPEKQRDVLLRGVYEVSDGAEEYEPPSLAPQSAPPRRKMPSKTVVGVENGKRQAHPPQQPPRRLTTSDPSASASPSDDSDDVMSGSWGRRAILRYLPPTAKPLVRERTPVSGSSSPLVHVVGSSPARAVDSKLIQTTSTTTRNKHTAVPLLPPKTPTRNPKTLLSPTKSISLLTPRTPSAAAAREDDDPRSRAALRTFQSRKALLATTFLAQLDARVTQGLIAEKLSALGGLKIVWSKTMLTTAGFFRYRYIVPKMSPSPPPRPVVTFAQIELAEKVVDDERRLYSTLAHEFAHVADVLLGENLAEGGGAGGRKAHGKGFQMWLGRCKRAFPEYRIEGGTCHDYVVNYKYQWACVGRMIVGGDASGSGCGHVVKRHSKSVDVEIHRCPGCGGRFAQTHPKPRRAGGGEGGAGGDAAGVSEYQLFVKERMGRVKRENPGLPQKDVMKLVGQQWREKKLGGESGGVGKAAAAAAAAGGGRGAGKPVVEVVELSSDDDDDGGDDDDDDDRELEGRLGGLRI